MRYFNREGQQINYSEWHRLSRSRTYCLIRATEDWYYKMTTSWVGLQADCEDKPTIFMFTKRLLQVDPKVRPKDWLRPEWFATMAEALAHHEAIHPADKAVCLV
jgi:hypothetical protein